MSLRDKLFGAATSLKDKIHEMVAPVSYTAPETPAGNAQTDPLLTPSKPAPEQIKVEDNALVPQPKLEDKKEVKPIKSFDVPFIGTNYDPYDPEQTKENPDGKGKALVAMDDSMVATSLKEDGLTGNLRLGTVIRVPSLGNKIFLVADTMNKRFNGMNKIDFVRKGKKKEPDPEVNKEFHDIEILREGNGPEDARDFVDSGEWEKMQKGHYADTKES